MSGTRTYLHITVAGHSGICLLDTGCNQSMLPRRLVPNTPLATTTVRVYAANGTRIPVMGTVTLRFELAALPVHCRFLVSDAVDEPMLRIDWLTANDCHWDFVRGTIKIGGMRYHWLCDLAGPSFDVCTWKKMCRFHR